jgi:hypothetical protein
MFAAAGGSVTNAVNEDVLVSGGAGNVSYAGTITDDVGVLVAVTGSTGGTKAFSGAITDGNDGDGAGIVLTNNGGATIAFSGGLVLSTGGNPAFTATGGGTVVVCDENPCGASGSNGGLVNTLATTTGTALNVASTTIGTNNLEFRSISSNGGSNTGIILNTTGSTGGLKVKGTGSAGSGGTIANKTGADGSTTTGVGIYLNATANVSLDRMQLNDFQNFAIRGLAVSGFTLANSTISGANGTNPSIDSYGEGSVYFGTPLGATGLTGSASVTTCNVSGGRARNFSVVNTSGTLDRLTVTGTTFGLTQATSVEDSLAVEARNAGTIARVTVTGSTFTGAAGDLGDFTGQTGTTMDVVFQGNTCSNTHPGNNIGGGGMALQTQGSYTFDVSGNSFRGANGSAITLFKASAGTLLSGALQNNTIGVAGVAGSGSATGNGIFVSAAGAGTLAFTIRNNQIHQIHGNAHIYADNTGGSYTANFTIQGNLLDTPEPPTWFAGIAVTNGAPASGDTVNVCAAIGGATVAERNTLNLGGDLGVIVGSSGAGGGHTFNLPSFPGPSNQASVESFIQGRNQGSFTTNAYADAPATFAAFTGSGTSCPTP